MICPIADELGLERGVARGELVVGRLEAADRVLAPRRQPDGEITAGGGAQGLLDPGESRSADARVRRLPVLGGARAVAHWRWRVAAVGRGRHRSS